MALNFYQVIRDLENIGLTDVILPFLLIFVILFAALQKTRILGSKLDWANVPDNEKAVKWPEYTGKKYNMVVSLVVALLVVVPHVMWPGAAGSGRLGGPVAGLPDAVQIINNSLPSISVWIVGILMLLLILGLFGHKYGVLGVPLASWVTGAAVVIVVYIFGASAGWFPRIDRLKFLYTSFNASSLIIILVFAILIWFIVKKSPQTGLRPSQKAMNEWWGAGNT